MNKKGWLIDKDKIESYLDNEDFPKSIVGGCLDVKSMSFGPSGDVQLF